jgi:hypothetical protein
VLLSCVQPLQYMEALWAACQQAAAARQDNSAAELKIQQLHSLAELVHSSGTAQPCSQHSCKGDKVNRSGQQQQQQQDARSGQQQMEQQLGLGQICAEQHQRQQQQQQIQAGIQQGWQHSVDAVVVAAGAAVGSLAELEGQLPLKLCQGYTLDMVPPTSTAAATAPAAAAAAAAAGGEGVPTVYPASAPSLLGSPYVASQGGQVLVVGATKQYDYTTQQAVAELSRCIDPSILHAHLHQQQEEYAQECVDSERGSSPSPQPAAAKAAEAAVQATAAAAAEAQGGDMASEVVTAAAALLRDAGALWPGIQAWTVAGIRSGVRALPPKDHKGILPFAGRWGDLQVGQQGQREEEGGQQQQQQQAGAQQQEVGQQRTRQQAGVQQQEAAGQQQEVVGQLQECGQQRATGHGPGTGDSSVGDSSVGDSSVPVWLLVGLGARGLLYHAWLGQLIAAAVLSNSEDHLPPELLSWRHQKQQQQQGSS